jgi:hypothetical protein
MSLLRDPRSCVTSGPAQYGSPVDARRVGNRLLRPIMFKPALAIEVHRNLDHTRKRGGDMAHSLLGNVNLAIGLMCGLCFGQQHVPNSEVYATFFVQVANYKDGSTILLNGQDTGLVRPSLRESIGLTGEEFGILRRLATASTAKIRTLDEAVQPFIFESRLRSIVLVQREDETRSGRRREIPPYGRGFSRHEDLSIRCGRQSGPPPVWVAIVSTSPSSYPSAWLRPRRARFRFT